MASAPPILTFLTDFGLADGFVGQMKGAALAVRGDLVLVDLTHEVPAHDVRAGAFLLETAYGAFPEGTIHVAVVDPGVGTERRALAVETERYRFVAPDNGLLTRALRRERVRAVHAIVEPRYRRGAASRTFEGRDVFAPAAAWIASGVAIDALGPAVADPVRLDLPRVRLAPGETRRVPVLLVDRFGNATLDVSREILEEAFPEGTGALAVRLDAPGGGRVDEWRATYAEGPPGVPFVLVNSAGYLEVALREGRADERLGLAPGVEIDLRLDRAAGARARDAGVL